MADSAEDIEFHNMLLETVPHLRAYARSLVRNVDLADDLVHESIARALAASAQFMPGTNFRAWVFTILRHQYLNESRKWHNRVMPLQEEDMRGYGVGPPQQAHMDFLDFRRAFWQLPADQREALILIGASGVSYEEAAVICHCPIGTIKSRVSRARTELKRILDEDSVQNSLTELRDDDHDMLHDMIEGPDQR